MGIEQTGVEGVEQKAIEQPGVEQAAVEQQFFEQPPLDLPLFEQLLLELPALEQPGVDPLEAALGVPAPGVEQPWT